MVFEMLSNLARSGRSRPTSCRGQMSLYHKLVALLLITGLLEGTRSTSRRCLERLCATLRARESAQGADSVSCERV